MALVDVYFLAIHEKVMRQNCYLEGWADSQVKRSRLHTPLYRAEINCNFIAGVIRFCQCCETKLVTRGVPGIVRAFCLVSIHLLSNMKMQISRPLILT